MNTAPQVDDDTMEVLLRFPLQHYFMNSGPWMSRQMYLLHGAAALITILLLYLLVKRRGPATVVFAGKAWSPAPDERASVQQ
jgi:hypothetical protein